MIFTALRQGGGGKLGKPKGMKMKSKKPIVRSTFCESHLRTTQQSRLLSGFTSDGDRKCRA